VKSAKEVLKDVLFRNLVQGMVSTRRQNEGVPNALYREISALNENVDYNSLPKHLKDLLEESSHKLLLHMNREGYMLVPRDSVRK